MKVKSVFKGLFLTMLAAMTTLNVHAQYKAKKQHKTDSIKKEQRLKTVKPDKKDTVTKGTARSKHHR